jgi:hypothetical protein
VIPASVIAALQRYLDDVNIINPPDYGPPWTSAEFRHPCPRSRVAKHTGRATSASLSLVERYVTLREVFSLDSPDVAPIELDPMLDDFAIIYREGTCSRCGQTARSKVGRIVATAERPPLEGRVSRE